MDPINANHEELLAAQRAAEWLDRLKLAGMQEQDRAAFVRWLKESRGHVREMLLATAWDTILGQLDPNRQVDAGKLMSACGANVVPVGGVHSRTPPKRYRGHPWRWVVSLGVTFTAVAALLLAWSGLLTDLIRPNQYSTAVGEQRAIELADGSLVALNTQSNVRIDFSDKARDVYLSGGQAIFVVTHDALRPFRVHVGTAVIQAIGTKFDVHRMEGRTKVAVIEGVIEINPDTSRDSVSTTLDELSERTRVAAGEAASIIINGQVTPPAAINTGEVSAWQQRRLIFRSSTLAEIVHEFGRYNRTPQIRIEGDELRAKRYSGVFDADDPESLLQYLASDGDVVLEHEGDRIIARMQPHVVPSALDQ